MLNKNAIEIVIASVWITDFLLWLPQRESETVWNIKVQVMQLIILNVMLNGNQSFVPVSLKTKVRF